MKIAFYGSSLLSAYWNGAATYYRGILRALALLGYDITFYEPDAYDRQKNRDIEPPEWAKVVVYEATEEALERVLREARHADIVIKANGVGVFDEELVAGILRHARPGALRLYWDVDAPATLQDLRSGAAETLRRALPELDAVLTYGGGAPVTKAYEALGARRCTPIYNALDTDTHHPVPPDPAFEADLAFLGNRLPDREARVAEFFFKPARLLPDRRFLLGGSGWQDYDLPSNVRYLGHVRTADHNALNCTPLAVLNVTRDAMVEVGFSPATRVFEAAGAGACLISDTWPGLDAFFAPGREILAASGGEDVARQLAALDRERASSLGQAALYRALADHTYVSRAQTFHAVIGELAASNSARSVPA